MHKRIARTQLIARREKEEGSAGAVRDEIAGLPTAYIGEAGRSRALLFESLDADFKL
jgi:hypothetical protein